MVDRNAGEPLREQMARFMQEKDRIELEIHQLVQVLHSNGNIGMNEPLVDAEGYPRADIDVYQVRHARHRIICLQNDHKDILQKIEQALHAIHAENRGDAPPANNVVNRVHMNGNRYPEHHELNNGGLNEAHLNRVVRATENLTVDERPFVKVDFVSIGSPADIAGLQIGDEVLEFGTIKSGNFTNVNQIGALVQHSIGAKVDVKVRRGNIVIRLALTPGTWAGRGLLGCNIIPA